MDEQTDHQLLEAYAGARDTRAFGCFVDRHEARLISYAGTLLRDSGLAQDVAQEVFFRVARNPERVLDFFVRTRLEDEPHGARNWLLKVARDLSLDRLRQRYVEQREAGAVGALQTQRAEQQERAPAQAAEAREDLTRMQTAIRNLPPRLRELVVLKVQQHKSYKEIAELTGLTATHVGVLLHQALQELSRELNPQSDA